MKFQPVPRLWSVSHQPNCNNLRTPKPRFGRTHSEIGEANTHEALDFLQNLNRLTWLRIGGLQVWPAAQVALRNAL